MSTPEHQQLIASRLKTVVALAGSLVFVAISLVAELTGDSSIMLRLGGIFFGLGTIIFSVTLVCPHRLTLDPTGFTLSGGLIRSPRKLAWDDVDGF